MTCAEFSRRWQERLNEHGSLPSPAEVDHLSHCEHCHALAEAGELLSQALADWRGSAELPATGECDREVTRRQSRLIRQLTRPQITPQSSGSPRDSRPPRRMGERVRVAAMTTAVLGLAVLFLWARPASDGTRSLWQRTKGAALVLWTRAASDGHSPGALPAPPVSAVSPVAMAEEGRRAGPTTTHTSTSFPPMALLASARDLVGIGLMPKAQTSAQPAGVSSFDPAVGQPRNQEPAPETLLADLEPIRRGMGSTLDFLWLVSEANSR